MTETSSVTLHTYHQASNDQTVNTLDLLLSKPLITPSILPISCTQHRSALAHQSDTSKPHSYQFAFQTQTPLQQSACLGPQSCCWRERTRHYVYREASGAHFISGWRQHDAVVGATVVAVILSEPCRARPRVLRTSSPLLHQCSSRSAPNLLKVENALDHPQETRLPCHKRYQQTRLHRREVVEGVPQLMVHAMAISGQTKDQSFQTRLRPHMVTC